MIPSVIASDVERRWLRALVSLREYATFTSDGWCRTAAAIDIRRERLASFDSHDTLVREYIATVLGRRVRVDDASTQPAPFVRDAAFALRYLELQTGVAISAARPPSWLGEWAVAD